MLADAGTWGADFADTYWVHHRRKQERRQRQRARRGEPSSETVAARAAKQEAATARIHARFAVAQTRQDFEATLWQFIEFCAKSGDPDAKLVRNAELAPFYAAQRREQQADMRTRVQRRLNEGYRSPGGPVGGNPAYQRDPFIYPGLVSDEHPIFKLFVASTPRASRLQTGDTKAKVHCTGQKLLALDDPYVDTAKDMRRVLRVEVDRSFAGGVELAAAITACGVPPPNLIVGYIDRTGRLHNPHLIWLLEHSVAFTCKGHQLHQKLFNAVLHGLTAALLPIGADPGGLANPRRVKNPLSPEWDRDVPAAVPYALASNTREGAPGLAALAPSLDLDGARALLRAATEARQGRPPAADHPDPAIAAQSNALFRHLSGFARARVHWCRNQGNATEAEFRQVVQTEALRLNSHAPAAEPQAIAMAESVARWTWDHYRSSPVRTPCKTPQERHDRQAAGQAKGATTRRDATRATLIAAAQILIEGGQRLTRSAVGAAAGKNEKTVRDHWPAILAAIRSPIEEPAVPITMDSQESGAEVPDVVAVAAEPSSLAGARLPSSADSSATT